jgi:ABC-2 type transport system permease protein
MIWTVLQVSAGRLLHNQVELLLTFIVPIAFFSIFAVIFGGGVGSGTTPKIRVVVVDEIDSSVSHAVIASLKEQAGLRFMREKAPASLSRQEARKMVRGGTVTMAIVLHQTRDEPFAADLLADSSDQVASQVVTALVARCLMLAKANLQADKVVRLPGTAGLLEETIKQHVAKPAPVQSASQNSSPQESDPKVVEPVEVIDVIGKGKSNPVVSMYAAGIAVMFLLFGATGGGGALLEERENQTLDRLLSTQLSMDQLLIGKWFYMTALGVLQVTVMFLWAQLIFGVDLLGHLDGFVMMTLVTALAASAFGLFLATLCKTRGQLNGLSVILVLSMSALGGSMVPRYVMSERIQQFGLCTFNAWALDGYDKVFWRDLPVSALGPQLSVLMCSGFAFLLAARALATRWETD